MVLSSNPNCVPDETPADTLYSLRAWLSFSGFQHVLSGQVCWCVSKGKKKRLKHMTFFQWKKGKRKRFDCLFTLQTVCTQNNQNDFGIKEQD